MYSVSNLLNKVALAGLALVIVASGCKKKEEEVPVKLPDVTNTTPNNPANPDYPTTPYKLPEYAGFPKMNIPANNPLTVEGIALGRKLYYDPALSQGGPQQGNACASCHFQAKAFSTSGTNNSVLPHINLGWNYSFLWDGLIEGTMEDIMRFEVEDFFKADLSTIKASEEYQELYNKAFGNNSITPENTAKALAQFFRTLNSADSKFDKFKRGELQLTDKEQVGLNIFNSEVGDCFHCHGYPLFTDNLFHNIGLDSISAAGSGRSHVTGRSDDRGKFKTATLRNIELTGPYMHDNRFNTLEEVIDFYNAGVQDNENLDPLMSKSHADRKLNLNPYQKEALVAFLKTLTDRSFTENPDLSKP
jgi:cytochrome c peroxidase